MNTIETLLDEMKSRGWKIEKNSSGNFYEFYFPNDRNEKIIVVINGTSITGSERSKPQIRLFTDSAIQAYNYAIENNYRFFAFALCYTNQKEYSLKFKTNFNPNNYLVSLESKFDNTTPGRLDIRSMYDFIEKAPTKNFSRVLKNQHNSAITQGAFIKIVNEEGNLLLDYWEEYVTYFDNRPYMDSSLSTVITAKEYYDAEQAYNTDEPSPLDYPHNILLFGAPGTGKSYDINKVIIEENIVHDRITFYEDLTYQQFVGGLFPKTNPAAKESVTITSQSFEATGEIVGEQSTFEFVPGILTKLLMKAIISKLKHENISYAIIIEELNRANAASVFGDFFQLLDRNKGVSEYAISLTEEYQAYFKNELHRANIHLEDKEDKFFETIKFPNNFYIFATMNSADQGVFTIDAAFKRRWNIIYKDINDIQDSEEGIRTIALPRNIDDQFVVKQYEWNGFRKLINNVILSNGFDEDRCIGYWFLTLEELGQIEEMYQLIDLGNTILSSNPLVDKLFYYLRQDVFRHSSGSLFKEGHTNLTTIRSAFISKKQTDGTPLDITNIISVSASDLNEIELLEEH